MKLPSLREIFTGWKKEEPKKEEDYVITQPVLKVIADRYAFDQYLKSVAAYEKLSENTRKTFQQLHTWKTAEKNGSVIKELYKFFKDEVVDFWGELTTIYTHGGRHILPQKLQNADLWVHMVHSRIEMFSEDEVSIIQNYIINNFNKFYMIVIQNWRPSWIQRRSPVHIFEEFERLRTDKVGFGEE